MKKLIPIIVAVVVVAAAGIVAFIQIRPKQIVVGAAGTDKMPDSLKAIEMEKMPDSGEETAGMEQKPDSGEEVAETEQKPDSGEKAAETEQKLNSSEKAAETEQKSDSGEEAAGTEQQPDSGEEVAGAEQMLSGVAMGRDRLGESMNQQEYVENQVIAVAESKREAKKIAKEIGGELISYDNQVAVIQIGMSVEEMMQLLEEDSSLPKVYPNYQGYQNYTN